MKFTDFKNRSQVLKMFKLDFSKKNFVQKKKLDIDERDKKKLLKNFKRPGAFGTESSICEMIISKILLEVCDANDIPLWSHYYFESKEVDLSGYPDYLLALSEVGDEEYKKAIVCCIEAKKDDFEGGWGQASAAMVAAQTENGNKDIPIYGLVTTGELWKFAVLKGSKFIAHEESISATKDFQILLDYLNWIFCEGRKNADILEELENES